MFSEQNSSEPSARHIISSPAEARVHGIAAAELASDWLESPSQKVKDYDLASTLIHKLSTHSRDPAVTFFRLPALAALPLDVGLGGTS